MYCNRDELMLFSRTGRFPPATRDGPGRRRRVGAYEQDLSRRRDRGGSLRRVLARLRSAAPVASPPPEPVPSMRGYADHQAYLELEFAVGFAVEEEKLR